jgi:hypothetical protein
LFTINNEKINNVNYTTVGLPVATNTAVHLVSDGTNWQKIN